MVGGWWETEDKREPAFFLFILLPSMSLAKILILLLTAYHVDIGCTRAPTPPASQKELVPITSWIEAVFVRLGFPALFYFFRVRTSRLEREVACTDTVGLEPYAWIPDVAESVSILAAHNTGTRASRERVCAVNLLASVCIQPWLLLSPLAHHHSTRREHPAINASALVHNLPCCSSWGCDFACTSLLGSALSCLS
jgi:hypothetical protein